jgi:hypothetical protein
VRASLPATARARQRKDCPPNSSMVDFRHGNLPKIKL